MRGEDEEGETKERREGKCFTQDCVYERFCFGSGYN